MFCLHVSVDHMLAVPRKTRRCHWILWNYSYGWLLAALWVLRTESGAFGS